MSELQAIILGIIQGLTEFLPISSSGHLVLSQELMGIEDGGVSFEILVHLGTALSVLIYYRMRLVGLVMSLFDKNRKRERMLILYLFLATLPTVVIALLLKDQIEAAFSSPKTACVMLMITGGILMLPKFLATAGGEPSAKSALAMGIAQSFAILPGISRSGSTIVAGRLFGMKPDAAAEFSFLMAIPAICGAGVFKFKDMLEETQSGINAVPWGPYLLGGLAAFVSGLFAIYAVLATIRRGKFQYFAPYCLILGFIGLIILINRPS